MCGLGNQVRIVYSFKTGCPKNDTDLVGSSDVNLALTTGKSLSKCFRMVNLSMGISFVGICPLRAAILKELDKRLSGKCLNLLFSAELI